MTDKKITDEEIKSSLEVIATTRNCNECKIRNCKWGTCNCSQITANAALDLINRQKAEIEKLKGSTIVSNIMESKRLKVTFWSVSQTSSTQPSPPISSLADTINVNPPMIVTTHRIIAMTFLKFFILASPFFECF